MNGIPAIAVVGDGCVGWLAAAILAMRVGGEPITVIPTEDGDHGLGPFGDAVIAPPEWQLRPIASRLAEAGFDREAGISPSLGIAFSGFSLSPWFLPFGQTGAPFRNVAFYHLVTRLRLAGHQLRLSNYSLAALAAQANRFAPPEADARSIRSSLSYAAHLDVNGLSRALETLARRMGVRVLDAPCLAPRLGAEGIEELLLAEDGRFRSDLYVDTTGEIALLAGALPGDDFEDWGTALPCDAAISRYETGNAFPYALHRASETGWSAEIAMAGRRLVTDFLSSKATPVPYGAARFRQGMRPRGWNANCVAVGAAGMLLEPLLGTPLLSATTAIERIADLLPHGRACQPEASEYNRLNRMEGACLRDAVAAIWALNGRSGQAIWEQARQAPRSMELERKLELFGSRGIVPMEDAELIDEADWTTLLDGMGLHPDRHYVRALAIPPSDIEAHLLRLRERLIGAVREMPAARPY